MRQLRAAQGDRFVASSSEAAGHGPRQAPMGPGVALRSSKLAHAHAGLSWGLEGPS
eukprot:NODE_4284_length_818_cov_5.353706_g3545_i0.p5 GENE.NODE_4284_length_818_cov_5.353706_g3545_i0~~NODE_4284_length_818_cov_5.353706_g3545_i0.p5  ORF type:complete len:56 (-),score=5.04 NODE_4284_length_818_cov_5.353706_g3545_i0:90-257(-)